MTCSKDYRIEILLLIPSTWLVFFLCTSYRPITHDEALDTLPQWDLSKLQVVSPSSPKADVLRSIFDFQNIPVNTSDAELLMTIPGIGPVLAEKIIDTRLRSGPFESPNDLARVHGIGPIRIESFSPYLRFD